ncbi:MAG: nitrite/sulfite reductase, partial [Anaerolineae bacterium]|nr:nitrite/sulfite reductase [Anaerolineae bacterium]
MTVERAERTIAPRPAQELNWDLVWKKNSIERLKKEKFPLDIVDDLPDLIRRGYEEIAEEDVVRFQWYGLYHDKPKIGYFMMRIKIPGGILTPPQLRTIGQLSVKYGRNFGELSTRQNIQLHWIQLAHLPDILKTLEGVGLTLKGGCGDTVRNITGSPLAGLDPNELFDVRPVVQEAARFFYGNREYSNLPRKHKITISAAPDQGNAPEINCIALVGAIKDGREGFGVRIGGGLSTVPRLSDDLGVFVEKADALPVLRAIIDVWKEDLTYRLSRVKARLKFMVKDIGPEAYRQRVEAKLGRRLEDFAVPPAVGETETVGVHPQKQKNRHYIGFPVFAGLMSG